MASPTGRAGSPAAEPQQSGFSALRRRHERVILTGISVGLSGLVFAIFARGAGKWTALVLALSAAAYFVATGLRGLRRSSASPVLSASLNLVQSGKLAAAEALLATLKDDAAAQTAVAVGMQRAAIAMKRGDLAAAKDLLDRVLARTGSGREPGPLAAIAAQALGLRAWARAASGDVVGAVADVEAVRAAAEPAPTATAHASLAEAFLAQRRADRAALAAHLRHDRRLLMYGLDVRERALVRAMQRLLGTPATSIYRTPASVEKTIAGEAEPPIAEWIARVAPDLVAFAPRPPAAPPGAPPDAPIEPSAAMLARVRARSQAASSDSGALAFAVWGGLATLFAVVYKLAPVPPGPVPIHPWIALAAMVVPALLYGASEAFERQRRMQVSQLQSLAARAAFGEDIDADLGALADTEQETIAAQVELLRASIADRRALLGEALAHADAARERLLSDASRASAAPFLAPAAGASRAYSLAALRRVDEAAAEVAQLPADYVYLDRTRFVVRLVSLVATGDIEAAGRLVDATPQEISLGPRDELVRDLVRAATSPGGAGVAELARLREELRDDAEQRLWIERVAPSLLSRFEHATAMETAQSEASQDDLADIESLAELEALLAESASLAAARKA